MEELKNKIIALCNQSGLPLEAMVFVLKDAWRDAEESYRNIQQRQATIQDTKEESKEEEK